MLFFIRINIYKRQECKIKEDKNKKMEDQKNNNETIDGSIGNKIIASRKKR